MAIISASWPSSAVPGMLIMVLMMPQLMRGYRRMSPGQVRYYAMTGQQPWCRGLDHVPLDPAHPAQLVYSAPGGGGTGTRPPAHSLMELLLGDIGLHHKGRHQMLVLYRAVWYIGREPGWIFRRRCVRGGIADVDASNADVTARTAPVAVVMPYMLLHIVPLLRGCPRRPAQCARIHDIYAG